MVKPITILATNVALKQSDCAGVLYLSQKPGHFLPNQ
jgi:hypothetical protein